jgi:uncharacterized protein (DUF3820 family)
MAMSDDTPKIIPFGKYKGRLVEELLVDDPAYLQWLAGQDWFRAKFNILHQVIINRGAEPEETPEHNAIQVKFLDDDFCVRLLDHIDPQYCEKAITALRAGHQHNLQLIGRAIVKEQENLTQAKERVARYTRDAREELDKRYYSRMLEGAEKDRDRHVARVDYLFRVQKEFTPPIVALQFRVTRQFEERGVDVILTFSLKSTQHDVMPPNDLSLVWYHYDESRDPYGWSDLSYSVGSIHIELKPVIGDDYPAILRQMKRTGADVLFVGAYTGQGATEEQFVQTMATAGIRVVFAREVEG